MTIANGEWRRWPTDERAQTPAFIYSDPAIYGREQERIFAGRTWNYVALSAELSRAGDFKTTCVGEHPVVVTRGNDGVVNVLANRCAHRGAQFCRLDFGNTRSFVCPYHQWSYNLRGDLIGVPFRNGLNGQGGMPPDFKLRENHLQRLKATERHGVIFASFAEEMESFEEYLGESMMHYFDRVFDGRELRVLGYSRQRIECNWKLMVENIKDPYHATLLHVFLVSFGLFRADNRSEVKIDASGRHACLVSSRGSQPAVANDQTKALSVDFRLNDPRLIEPVREFAGAPTVVMQTIWPNLIVQQQSNSLAARQIVPRGPSAFELHWTFFGYAGDDREMTTRRLRQANLFGPAGLVSLDDSEVIELAQKGLASYGGSDTLLAMGGREWGDEGHMLTEGAVRAMYSHYRKVMDL